jgi:O-6-methylguanine DNA methyltransferase
MTAGRTVRDLESTIYIDASGDTPLGRLWLAHSQAGLVAVACGGSQAEFESYLIRRFKRPVLSDPGRLSQASSELVDYLNGRRHHFELIIDWLVLRPFQRSVLQATFAIPYGETRTYKEIAEQVGRPRAARAVGRAEATNPMPLVIPCHRVIGADGRLHGYGLGEGVRTKEWLLRMEGAIIA